MQSDSPVSVRLLVLTQEIDDIHRANRFYWALGPEQRSCEAVAEYERGQLRLEEIRREIWALTIEDEKTRAQQSHFQAAPKIEGSH